MVVTYKSFEAGVMDWIKSELVDNMHGMQRFAMTTIMVAYAPVMSKKFDENIKALKDMEVVTADGMVDVSKCETILKKSFSMNDDRITFHLPLVNGDVTMRPCDVERLTEFISCHSSGA